MISCTDTHFVKGSSRSSQPFENPVPVQDITILEQRHKAGHERIPAGGEVDDLLNAQVVDAFEIPDSSSGERLRTLNSPRIYRHWG